MLRLIRALLPVASLFVGKLIIDDVVGLLQRSGKPEMLQQWLASGLQMIGKRFKNGIELIGGE